MQDPAPDILCGRQKRSPGGALASPPLFLVGTRVCAEPSLFNWLVILIMITKWDHCWIKYYFSFRTIRSRILLKFDFEKSSGHRLGSYINRATGHWDSWSMSDTPLQRLEPPRHLLLPLLLSFRHLCVVLVTVLNVWILVNCDYNFFVPSVRRY